MAQVLKKSIAFFFFGFVHGFNLVLFNPLVNKVFSFFFRVERINFQRVVFFVGFANVPLKGFVVKFGAEVKEDEHGFIFLLDL